MPEDIILVPFKVHVYKCKGCGMELIIHSVLRCEDDGISYISQMLRYCNSCGHKHNIREWEDA